MPAQFDNAVSREVTWFTQEPPASFPSAPPLIKASGGAFDLIQGYVPKEVPRQRCIFIVRERAREARIAFGEKEWVHHMRVIVVWPLDEPKAEDDLQLLDTAIAAVMTRIRGPFGDKSHGGQFVGVGEDDAEIEPDFGDQLTQVAEGGPLEVHIAYQATDSFPA